MPYIWRELRREGPMTIIEVMVEPGRNAEIPVRPEIVGTDAMDAMLDRIFAKHAATKDALGDFT